MVINRLKNKGEGVSKVFYPSKSNRYPSQNVIHAELRETENVKPYPKHILELAEPDVYLFFDIVMKRSKHSDKSYINAFDSIKKDCIYYFGWCRYTSYDSLRKSLDQEKDRANKKQFRAELNSKFTK